MSMLTLTESRGMGNTVRYDFTSDLAAPTFYVWVLGILFATTKVPFIVINLGSLPYIRVDVFDDAGDSPDICTSPTITEFWEATPDATAYEIQQYDIDSAAWVARARIREGGTWWYAWTSGPLTDCTTHQFRIRSIGQKANGEWREFSIYVVRNPDHPAATATLNELTGVISFA